MFGSVQSSILMFGEHYEHLGTSKVIQSVANMGYIKRKKIIIFSILLIEHSLLSIFSCNKIWHFVINNFSVWKKNSTPKFGQKFTPDWCAYKSSMFGLACSKFGLEIQESCSKCSKFGVSMFEVFNVRYFGVRSTSSSYTICNL